MNRTAGRFVSALIVGVCMFTIGAAPARAASTIAYWQFNSGDNTSSTFVADSAGSNTLTNNSNSVASSSSVPTTSLGLGPLDPSPNMNSASFNGASSFQTNSVLPLSGNTAITLEWFMKEPDTTTDNGKIVFEDSANTNSNGAAFFAYLFNPTKLEVVRSNITLSALDNVFFDLAGAGIDVTQWHEYAVVLTNTAPYEALYVDDQPITFSTVGGGQNIGPTGQGFGDYTAYIGARGGSSLDYTGLIDEMRITSGALAPGEFLDDLPEPASASLLVAGVLLVAQRRNRRNAA